MSIICYIQDTPTKLTPEKWDPILSNKRYPQDSEKQYGRWTTESKGSFSMKAAHSPVSGGGKGKYSNKKVLG